MNNRKRLVGTVTVVGVLAAAVAAAALARQRGSALGPRAKTAVEITQEFRGEAARLVLAPGWSWPLDPGFAKTGPDGTRMVYEPGYGRTRADSLWFCSWAESYLATKPRSLLHVRASQRLPRIFNMFFFRVALVPGDRPAFSAMVARAVRGRTRPLKRYVRLNCPRPAVGTDGNS